MLYYEKLYMQKPAARGRKSMKVKSRYIGKRMISVILVTAMLAASGGFTALAKTVSENQGVAGELNNSGEASGTFDEGEAADNGTSLGNPDRKKAEPHSEAVVSGNSKPSEENTRTGKDIPSNAAETEKEMETIPEFLDAAQEGTPANPVHRCTEQEGSTDYYDDTYWDYVYFGSYPQAEVTEAAAIYAIDNAIAVSGVKGDAGVDVWVNGTKYRRISKDDTNCSSYEFGSQTYRYFRWQRIRWKVLSSDGTTLFVVADKGLDCRSYNDTNTSITWEDCTLRSWLNDSFCHTAFSAEEQAAIVEQTIQNDAHPIYGTEGGNHTEDKIYLLSLAEVTNPVYGFCESYRKESYSRKVYPSGYSGAMGSDSGRAGCDWWLRSPGTDSTRAMNVSEYGSVWGTDTAVYWPQAIVPALHLELSSDMWLQTNDGTSGSGGGNPQSSNSDTSQKVPENAAAENDGDDEDGNDDEEQTDSDASHKETDTTGGSRSTQEKVKKLTINAPSKKLAAGKTVQLTVDVTPSSAVNQSVTWKVSNTKYASVTKTGKLKLKKAGAGKSVTITATAKDGSGVKATYKVRIMKYAVRSIKLAASSQSKTKTGAVTVSKNGRTVTVKAGKTVNLRATVRTTGKNDNKKVNKKLKWTSSNTKYATVSKSGKIKTKKAGKGKNVTITASSTDGSNKKARIKIKIK